MSAFFASIDKKSNIQCVQLILEQSLFKDSNFKWNVNISSSLNINNENIILSNSALLL